MNGWLRMRMEGHGPLASLCGEEADLCLIKKVAPTLTRVLTGARVLSEAGAKGLCRAVHLITLSLYGATLETCTRRWDGAGPGPVLLRDQIRRPGPGSMRCPEGGQAGLYSAHSCV